MWVKKLFGSKVSADQQKSLTVLEISITDSLPLQ